MASVVAVDDLMFPSRVREVARPRGLDVRAAWGVAEAIRRNLS